MRLDINKDWDWHWWQTQLLKKAASTNTMVYEASRQTGKTKFGRELIKDFLFFFDKRKNPYFIVLTPYCQQACDLYFKEIWQELEPLEGRIMFKQGSINSGRVVMTLKRPWLGDVATVIFSGTQNLDGVRGKTGDVVLLDEFAFMLPSVYTQVARPMTKATNGKIFISSTVNGYNHFYDVGRVAAGDDNAMGKFITFDYATCQIHPFAVVAAEFEYYKKLGKAYQFLQEFCNRYDASAVGEAPFAKIVNTLQTRDMVVSDERYVLNSQHIFAVLDRGKPGNNACWVGVIKNRQIWLYEYFDEMGNFEIINFLRKKFPNQYITMVYPSDIKMPSSNTGRTELMELQDYIDKTGWSRLTNIEVLDNIKSVGKKNLIEKTERHLRDIRFYLKGTAEGRKKLTNVKHPKNQQGVIDYKRFAQNDNQHCGDALCHLVEAYDLGKLAPTRKWDTGVPEVNVVQGGGRRYTPNSVFDKRR